MSNSSNHSENLPRLITRLTKILVCLKQSTGNVDVAHCCIQVYHGLSWFIMIQRGSVDPAYFLYVSVEVVIAELRKGKLALRLKHLALGDSACSKPIKTLWTHFGIPYPILPRQSLACTLDMGNLWRVKDWWSEDNLISPPNPDPTSLVPPQNPKGALQPRKWVYGHRAPIPSPNSPNHSQTSMLFQSQLEHMQNISKCLDLRRPRIASEANPALFSQGESTIQAQHVCRCVYKAYNSMASDYLTSGFVPRISMSRMAPQLL